MVLPTQLKISVFIAVSVDGFIARPDGDVDWLDEYEPLGAGDDGGYSDIFNAVDALVMGRGAFEKVLEFDPWPYETKPVIVLSKSLSEVPDKLRDRVTIDAAAPQAVIENCLRQGYTHIYLDGGQVIQSFLRAGLVDEMTLTIIPVLLGAGRPLFGTLTQDIKLHHVATRSWANGFVQSKYQVQR